MSDNWNQDRDGRRRGRPWFGPKRFGLGYRPQTWQGGVVMAVFILGTMILAALARSGSVPRFLPAVIAVITIAVVALLARRR